MKACLFLALCLLTGTVTAQAAVPGFGAYTSDSAKGYESVPLDITEVSTALRVNATKQADYAAAKDVYENGMNVPSDTPMVPQSAKGIFTNNYKGRPTYDRGSTYFNRPAFLDSFMDTYFTNTSLCCGIRTGGINGGMRYWPFYWSLIKIDAAYNKALQTPRDDDYIKSHVEQAVALWYGGEGATNSPFATAERYATRKCTNSSNVPGVNATANAAYMNSAKAFSTAALKGDKAGMDSARNRMVVASNAVLLQAFLYNYDEAVTPPDGYVANANPCLVACGRSVVEGISIAKTGTSLAYWRFLAPTMAAKAKSETDAVMANLQKGRLDMAMSKSIMPLIKTAASKNGINWNTMVDGCSA